MILLTKRSNCYYNSYGNYTCRNSSFSSWGRWVVLGVILVAAFLFLLCICCVTRRRRAKGGTPMYGTGWMPGTRPNNYNNNAQSYPVEQYPPQEQQYGSQGQQYGGQAPAYSPPQEQGYAPHKPEPAYQGANAGYYQPPPGPPPGRY